MAHTINKQFFTDFRADLNKHLAQLAAQYGLRDLKATNARFDPEAQSFTIKVEGIGQNGLSPEQSRYDTLRDLMHLPPRGTAINMRGTRYVVSGMTRANKVILDLNGKMFAAKAEAVVRCPIATPVEG